MTVPISWEWESPINPESQHYLWKWKPPSLTLWAVTSLSTSKKQLSAGSWVCAWSILCGTSQVEIEEPPVLCVLWFMAMQFQTWIFLLRCWLQIQYTETNSFFTLTVKRLTPQLLRTLIKGQHVLCLECFYISNLYWVIFHLCGFPLELMSEDYLVNAPAVAAATSPTLYTNKNLL